MKTRALDETQIILNQAADQQRWVIDGFGSLELMERRFKLADKIIFVDFPLWRHYWWCTKRQVKSIWRPRSELPKGCDEATVSYTIKLFKILWRVHSEIKPKLEIIFDRSEIKSKVVRISNLHEWKSVFNNGLL